ncbi:probable G-protein coupled receptor Mth-like 3 [Anoplolepis gracilipes]|uniref:probable G-protein coupled receptor Mth-like 3 n=1 Tax=Anoplolepis gracilipes TaxID=354296 RepID=UPI003BA160CD
MYDKNFKFWCCALLFFALCTKSLQNFTIDNKQDDSLMVRYELDVNSTEKNDKETVFDRHNLRKNFSVEYVKYHEKHNQMPRGLQANFTKVDNNKNDNKNYIVPYGKCNNITCIRLCCPLGDRYKFFRNCIPGRPEYVFSKSYNFWSDAMQIEYKKIEEVFQLIVQDPCPNLNEIIRITLDNDILTYFEYIFFENGTLYLPYFKQFVESTSYCLAVSNNDVVEAVICSKTLTEAFKEEKSYLIKIIMPLMDAIKILIWNCTIVSMLCMLTIFLTYYILPLQNLHSFMLRRYSSMIFIYYIGSIMSYSIQDKNLMYSTCVAAALISYFSSVASYFWLSVMSFDMWWTFRDFQSLQKNMKRQDKKKFLYSIIAWGGPFIFTTICIIMEIAPSVPKSIQPRFDVNICWFHFGVADQLYNYGPKIICSIISISLSIRTAINIMDYEKETTRRLKDSESRCYNENKKWAKLYLKLFIMLFVIIAIEWSIFTVWEFWLYKDIDLATTCIEFSLFILETIKDIGVFIIFVCRKTIMQSLLKHFCQNRRNVFKNVIRRRCYNLEDVHHCAKHNNFMEKYRQSEMTDKEFN